MTAQIGFNIARDKFPVIYGCKEFVEVSDLWHLEIASGEFLSDVKFMLDDKPINGPTFIVKDKSVSFPLIKRGYGEMNFEMFFTAGDGVRYRSAVKLLKKFDQDIVNERIRIVSWKISSQVTSPITKKGEEVEQVQDSR